MRTTSNKKIRAILFGHNDLPQSLFATLQSIVGEVEGIIPLSNKGISRSEMERRLQDVLGDSDHETLIFADLFGGSCSQVCQGVKREQKNLAIICGVNLPMLLEFTFARERMGFSELVNHLAEVGKSGIRIL